MDEERTPEQDREVAAKLQAIGVSLLEEFGYNDTLRICITLVSFILRRAPTEKQRRCVMGHIIEFIVDEAMNPVNMAEDFANNPNLAPDAGGQGRGN